MERIFFWHSSVTNIKMLPRCSGKLPTPSEVFLVLPWKRIPWSVNHFLLRSQGRPPMPLSFRRLTVSMHVFVAPHVCGVWIIQYFVLWNFLLWMLDGGFFVFQCNILCWSDICTVSKAAFESSWWVVYMYTLYCYWNWLGWQQKWRKC